MPPGPPPDSLLLALTTATDACGVALWQEGRVQVELALHRPRRHAERLAPLIREALEHGAVEASDLDAVALAAGPGSYTGLRIGTSTAKGLCAATGAALVAAGTLAAMAEAARSWAVPGDLLCPVLRSRRGEVYAAAFRIAEKALAPVVDAGALDTGEAARRFQAARREYASERTAWLLGSGAARVAEAFPAEVRSAFRVVKAASPTAGAVARLGVRRLAAGTVEDAAAFEPHYLKPFHVTPRRRSVFEERS